MESGCHSDAESAALSAYCTPGEPVGLDDVDIWVGWRLDLVAKARLGCNPIYPDRVYVPSWVTRVATAQVVATLRILAYQGGAITALRFDLTRPPGFWRRRLNQLTSVAASSGACDVSSPPAPAAAVGDRPAGCGSPR
ncbi:hypothetical protein RW1_011_02070 [Rhodococcus wratislaviensis NBRC 100605]|uniref:Uncharacterized protein n=1 Tax=Rhodococcus wratislaviensis NBRC 100605 TaxID=1219028 RepID=X0PNK5_RHOWR|nr:hypothetical protein RW1_011_02070 [Rhodococcus wratislaviensis NBRC 100605]